MKEEIHCDMADAMAYSYSAMIISRKKAEKAKKEVIQTLIYCGVGLASFGIGLLIGLFIGLIHLI